jgi:hypothetical protein
VLKEPLGHHHKVRLVIQEPKEDKVLKVHKEDKEPKVEQV